MTEVTFFYFVAIVGRAVGIGFPCGGLHDHPSLLVIAHVGVVEGVDVNGKSPGVIGQLLASVYLSVTEAAGIVVAHLALVVSIVLVGQPHALDGVVLSVKLLEDFQELVGNELVADEFAQVRTLVVIPVEHAEIAEV